MMKKINRKILFRATLAISSFLAVLLNLPRDNHKLNDFLLSNLDTRINSIELAYASGGGGAGGCSGGSCGSSAGGEPTYYEATDSGVGIIYSR